MWILCRPPTLYALIVILARLFLVKILSTELVQLKLKDIRLVECATSVDSSHYRPGNDSLFGDFC